MRFPAHGCAPTYGNRSVQAISDNEGYFRVELKTSGLRAGWHEIQLQLERSHVAVIGQRAGAPVGRGVRRHQRHRRHHHL